MLNIEKNARVYIRPHPTSSYITTEYQLMAIEEYCIQNNFSVLQIYSDPLNTEDDGSDDQLSLHKLLYDLKYGEVVICFSAAIIANTRDNIMYFVEKINKTNECCIVELKLRKHDLQYTIFLEITANKAQYDLTLKLEIEKLNPPIIGNKIKQLKRREKVKMLKKFRDFSDIKIVNQQLHNAPYDGYGPAITKVYTRDDGTMWVENNGYHSQINCNPWLKTETSNELEVNSIYNDNWITWTKKQ
jgi:hypothetical protein